MLRERMSEGPSHTHRVLPQQHLHRKCPSLVILSCMLSEHRLTESVVQVYSFADQTHMKELEKRIVSLEKALTSKTEECLSTKLQLTVRVTPCCVCARLSLLCACHSVPPSVCSLTLPPSVCSLTLPPSLCPLALPP